MIHGSASRRGRTRPENVLGTEIPVGRGAGLDVYEGEPRVSARLAAMPNVVVLPHIGSATEEARNAMARIAATEVARFLRGEGQLHTVT